jgi:hypothetical protein
MAKVERKRTARSVTLDDDVVEYAKRVGGALMPKRGNLSQIIDEALVEWSDRRDPKKKPAKK